jgi:flavin reductase (DIM6/NTAB) family NADH-FMN oxidoreductase RutF
MTHSAQPSHSLVTENDQALFRRAMRQLPGGASVITLGRGEDISGLTVTSVSSLAAEPPTIIFCINRSSSSWPVLSRHRAFAVNVLGPQHVAVAERFSGRGGIKGAARFADANWLTLVTGTPVLEQALAVLDCEVEEIIERHTSAIVVGRVVAVKVEEEAATPVSLAYWRGQFGALGFGTEVA